MKHTGQPLHTCPEHMVSISDITMVGYVVFGAQNVLSNERDVR